MGIVVPVPTPFSFDAVVRSHGWYDLRPFSREESTRTLGVRVRRGGATALLTFRPAAGGIEAEAPAGFSAADVRAASSRVFSLAVDLRSFHAQAAGDPDLSWATARGAGRFLRAPSLWEDAVKVLLTTNCTWAATRGMIARAVGRYGEEGAFPDPEAIARRRVSSLNAAIRSGYRTDALLAFSRRVASGRLDLSEWESPALSSAEIRARILAERGFGPYAAEGLLRLIGRHDFFAIDSWTRAKYRKLHPGRGSIERSIERRYARYGPFRGLAFWLDLTRDWHENREEVW